MNDKFKEIIKDARVKKGYSQRRLARMVGLHHSTYNDIENNSNYVIRLNSENIQLPLHVRTKKQGDKMIIKNMTNITQEDNANINSLLVESISGYETIKGLNLESTFIKKINKLYLNSINNSLNFSKIINIQELFNDLFEGIILLFVIYLGSTYIMDKSLTIGSLITYNSLVYYFITPIRNSLDFYKDLFYVKNSIQRINNILNYKYEKLDKETNLNISGNIKIKNLEFSYNNKSKIIDNFSLNINDKDKVLILGPSGTGKSTLLKILYKYYDISRDKIYIDNYDLNDFTLKDIRKNVTYISQNEQLYNDTIKNNIITLIFFSIYINPNVIYR